MATGGLTERFRACKGPKGLCSELQNLQAYGFPPACLGFAGSGPRVCVVLKL